MPPRLQGWGGFGAWAGVGALFGFSVVGAASIGLFFLPPAVLALVATGAFVRARPEVAGVLAGLGSIPLLVGVLNLGSEPCPGVAGSTSCGGLDPVPWFVAGAVLAGTGFAVYLVRPR